MSVPITSGTLVEELARELYGAFCGLESRRRGVHHPLWGSLRLDLRSVWVGHAHLVLQTYAIKEASERDLVVELPPRVEQEQR
jgi:hypothetical protein